MKLVFVDAEGRRAKFESKKGATVGDFAKEKGFSPQAFLFCKNNRLCLESDQLQEGDEIRIVRVISGG